MLFAGALSGCTSITGQNETPPGAAKDYGLDFFTADSTVDWGATNASAALPPVTVDAILERKSRSVSGGVKWHDADHLVAAFDEPGSDKSVTRLISLEGALEDPVAEGERVTLSPDGRTSLAHEEDGWVLQDLETGETHLIEPPADETRKFKPHYRAPVWSADSRYVAFIETHQPEGATETDEPRDMAGVKVIDMDARGPSPLSRWASRITIVDRFNPATVRRFERDDSALNMAWSDENALFAVAVRLFSGDASSAVVRIAAGSADMKEIYRTRGRFQSMTPVVQPGGKLIALVFNIDTRIWDEFQSIILIDAETGEEVRRLTQDLPILGGDYVWSNDGSEIYARVRGGGLDQIYAFPLDGEPRRLTNGLRRHFNIDLSDDGRRLAYQTMDGYGRGDIRVLDLKSGEEKVVLVVDEPATEFGLGEWRHVRWQSTDDVTPYGYVILPPDFDPNRRYPMIVDIHGGGPGSRLYLFGPLTVGVTDSPLEWHAWAALGYVVFVPDYRSTGDYGAEPIIDISQSGKMAANKDIEDAMSGTRFMLDQGFIDPRRVALLGHSAGGKRAYMILTKHDLFAAAILNEAITPDATSTLIGLTSGGNTGGYPADVLRQIFGGGLSEVPERYKENYMFDSYKNKTPTLIMVGNEELGGVAHMPNEIMYSILKQNGVPTRMLKFVEEGHNYTRPEAAKLAFEEVRRWLETHMALAED